MAKEFLRPATLRELVYDEFHPISLPADLQADEHVQKMLKLVNKSFLREWRVGRVGTHISSRFVTAGGLEDVLSSADPDDGNYALLVRAHIQRAVGVILRETKPNKRAA